MSKEKNIYTYRGGEKIELQKSSQEIVIRLLPTKVDDPSIQKKEQVSSSSTKVTVNQSELEILMEKSRILAPTHHAYSEVENNSDFLITDRIFILFKDELLDEQIDTFCATYGLIEIEKYDDRNYLFQLTDHTNMNTIKLVVKLTEDDPLVEIAEHDLNQRIKTYSLKLPSDPKYLQQWHLHTNFENPDYDPRSSTKCDEAWKLLDNYGSEDVVIAISDDGCKLDHNDFNSPNKFADWGYMRARKLITKSDINADPSQMYKEGSDHGTSCCGVIAGEVDASLIVGAAPECRLLPIQWESSGASLYISDSKLLTILNYIDDKVDIMSNSWGSSPSSLWAIQVIKRIKELSTTGGRRGKGIVFLWAAGNENCPLNDTTTQNVPYTHGWKQKENGSWFWSGVKSTKVFRNNLTNIPGVIHIAALASTAKRSHYSNYGHHISLSAPTSNSHKYYRLIVKGLGITTTTGRSSRAITTSFGGTSSATPLVAGISALVISANPKLSALEVIQILKQSASKDLNFSGYSQTPPSSYDKDTSWDISPIAPFDSGNFIDKGDIDGSWSPWFGYGKVDAMQAVTEAFKRANQIIGNAKFSTTSTPNRNIPDNSTQGVQDTIRCDKNFIIQSIKCKIDIKHTFIGDLIISLISPSGKAIKLHNRNGGSNNNIIKEFTISNLPQLQHFIGEKSIGEWKIKVQDLAQYDMGKLKEWSIELQGEEERSITVEKTLGLIIPDNKFDGITSTIDISQNGQLKDIEIEVNITHPYIGDLLIKLTSPDKTEILLHNYSGSSSDNIVKNYNILNTKGLKKLIGKEFSGNWKLGVSDHQKADQGKLNSWSLKIVPKA